MSVYHALEGGYLIDSTPAALPDGRFVARAIVTRRVDQKVEEFWPEFDPFVTPAEAASAAHMAAVAWVAHMNERRSQAG